MIRVTEHKVYPKSDDPTATIVNAIMANRTFSITICPAIKRDTPVCKCPRDSTKYCRYCNIYTMPMILDKIDAATMDRYMTMDDENIYMKIRGVLVGKRSVPIETLQQLFDFNPATQLCTQLMLAFHCH